MKLSPGIEKWGTGILGLLCVLLVAHLVTSYKSVPAAGAWRFPGAASKVRTHAGRGVVRAADDLAGYDPSLHTETLKELDARPLPDGERNPFEYGGVVPAAGPGSVQVAAGAAPAAPPPPPPPPIKPMGYNEVPGGGGEAFVSYQDQAMVVHVGDVVGSKIQGHKNNSYNDFSRRCGFTRNHGTAYPAVEPEGARRKAWC